MAPRASRLTRRRIDPARVLDSLSDPGAGALVLFLGTVRDTGEAGAVEGMEYEAYGEMAERALARVEERVRRLWPGVKGVRVVHRVGRLAVGDVSVAVAVSAPHRAEAFEACRDAIETIKEEATIWKRERTPDGRSVWVEGRSLERRRRRRA